MCTGISAISATREIHVSLVVSNVNLFWSELHYLCRLVMSVHSYVFLVNKYMYLTVICLVRVVNTSTNYLLIVPVKSIIHFVSLVSIFLCIVNMYQFEE